MFFFFIKGVLTILYTLHFHMNFINLIFNFYQNTDWDLHWNHTEFTNDILTILSSVPQAGYISPFN